MISLVEEAADPKESPIIQALPETLPQRVVDALLDLPHLRIQGRLLQSIVQDLELRSSSALGEFLSHFIPLKGKE